MGDTMTMMTLLADSEPYQQCENHHTIRQVPKRQRGRRSMAAPFLFSGFFLQSQSHICKVRKKEGRKKVYVLVQDWMSE